MNPKEEKNLLERLAKLHGISPEQAKEFIEDKSLEDTTLKPLVSRPTSLHCPKCLRGKLNQNYHPATGHYHQCPKCGWDTAGLYQRKNN